jgi:arsenate reductase
VQILNDSNVEYEIVDYLNNPPSVDELQSLANKMGINARDFIRTKEVVFKELNLQPHLDDERFIFQKMSENPKLIERPIVVKGERAVLGRPPAKIEDLLNS